MDRYKNFFKGKHVTVMGLGLLGRGIGDAKFLAECGAEVLITDLKKAEDLAASVAEFNDFPNVNFVLGEHRFEDFENRDFILKAAGVPFDSPYIEHARKAGVPIEMSASLFVKLAKIPMVGVTGTRGKSTVTHLVHHILSITFEESEDSSIILGGNIRGVSNLQLLKDVREHSIAVFELDSWQLQGFGEDAISPHIAIFTSFMPDHLNYYHNNLDHYLEDKANIFRYQEETDTFITVPEVFKKLEAWGSQHTVTFGGDVRIVDASSIPEDAVLPIPGEHNRLNIALAIEASRALGLTDDEIFAGIASFPGVAGRLEKIGILENGAVVYNDNNATTPDATAAALEALGSGNKKNIVLIIGGADKGIDMKVLDVPLQKFVKQVVMLPGTGTDRVCTDIEALAPTVQVESLTDAITQALEFVTEGDVLLFSPAFASFGLFANEYERNDQFIGIITPHLSD